MSQIINDAASVRRFAHSLRENEREVRAARMALTNSFAEVSRTWSDERSREARTRIEAAEREMLDFERCAAAMAEYLDQLAAKIDRYLRR